jgi:hypothetical protein
MQICLASGPSDERFEKSKFLDPRIVRGDVKKYPFFGPLVTKKKPLFGP